MEPEMMFRRGVNSTHLDKRLNYDPETAMFPQLDDSLLWLSITNRIKLKLDKEVGDSDCS